MTVKGWSKTSDQTRQCPMCEAIYPRTVEFWYRAKDGPEGLDYQCKPCKREYAKQWQRRNAKLSAERSAAARIKLKTTNWWKLTHLSSKHNAKVRGIEYKVDAEHIHHLYEEQGGLCYYTGVKLEITDEKKHPLSPSLDRKDTNLGYTTDNTVVCAWWVNMGKSHHSFETFRRCLELIDLPSAPMNRSKKAA